MTSAEALEQIGQKLYERNGDASIPSHELKRQAARLIGLQESSIIPSDFCYNRINAGIPLLNTPMFIQETRGFYRFVGLDYPFTGSMVHKPQGGAERIVANVSRRKSLVVLRRYIRTRNLFLEHPAA